MTTEPYLAVVVVRNPEDPPGVCTVYAQDKRDRSKRRDESNPCGALLEFHVPKALVLVNTHDHDGDSWDGLLKVPVIYDERGTWKVEIPDIRTGATWSVCVFKSDIRQMDGSPFGYPSYRGAPDSNRQLEMFAAARKSFEDNPLPGWKVSETPSWLAGDVVRVTLRPDARLDFHGYYTENFYFLYSLGQGFLGGVVPTDVPAGWTPSHSVTAATP